MRKIDEAADAAESDLLRRAKTGDGGALSTLLKAHEPAARRALRFLVAERDDVNDLMQETLLDAFTRIAEHETGTPFSLWLQTFAIRQAGTFLALKKRWRPAAQIHLQKACANAGISGDVMDVLRDDSLSFNIRDHVGFCFAAVGRSLPMQQQMAVVLTDLLDFSLEQAADALRMRVDDVRTYSDDGRIAMQALYDRMCRFSNAQGACDQCRGLRAVAPGERNLRQADPAGLDAESGENRRRHRLRVVREADIDRGPAQKLHDLLFGMLSRNEADRDTAAETDDEIPGGVARWEELQDFNN